MTDTPQRFGVVGAGTMGAGVAQLAALAGMDTLLYDPFQEALDRGIGQINANLGKGAQRGRWTQEDANAAAARLRAAESLQDMADRELVLEAAPEVMEIKHDLFQQLSSICSPETILATNTSSIPITQVASSSSAPENVIGLHFFNPAPLMRLVELIAALQTSERALAIGRATGEAMGKRVIQAVDGPGFLVNRLGRPFGSEGLRIYQEGIAKHDEIDRIYRVGGGYRMGPFELMDLIGIDVGLAVAKSFLELSFGEPRWRPSHLQARMVAAGRLGRKSGRGWYDYTGDGPYRPEDEPDATLTAEESDLLDRIQCCIVNEGAFTIGMHGTAEDIDDGAKLGLNWPKGPLELGRELGFDHVLATMDSLWDLYHEERYRAAPKLRLHQLS